MTCRARQRIFRVHECTKLRAGDLERRGLDATQAPGSPGTRVKHVIVRHVVTISIRELRQAWPRAEALLRTTGEITITRDGRPVARLVRVREPRRPRKRFDAARHLAWQSRLGRGRPVRWVDEFLFRERNAT